MKIGALRRFLNIKNMQRRLVSSFLTLIVYIAAVSAGAAVIVLVPFGVAKFAILLALLLGLSAFTTISIRGGDVLLSPAELQHKLDISEQAKERALTEIDQLRADLDNTSIVTNGKLDFLLKLEVAELKVERRRHCNFFVESGETENPNIEEWDSKGGDDFDAKNGDLRFIGVYRYPYRAVIGIDLCKVLGSVSENRKVLRYCLPETEVTGINWGGDDDWEIKLALKNMERKTDIKAGDLTWNGVTQGKCLVVKDRWILQPPAGLTINSIVNKIEKEERRRVMVAKELSPELKQASDHIAVGVFEGIVRNFLNMEPVLVPREELVQAKPFSDLLEELKCETEDRGAGSLE